ncbi:nuclear transport factor 2 family protein [Flavobacterium sp.]|uniref:nuclear transport factor 2 family protein n=1 Tax=Flavobacterium sp. TaxID=239 RepID=UPI001B748BB3|nr:nuclear transport factor 2 family protein [Flavobacterium sp.]MBP6181645.1 nuclear transport factor 2 family protein [Flavobacterium sp.]
MKKLLLGLLFFTSLQWSNAQTSSLNTKSKSDQKTEQEVIQLSKDKWLWMADKDVAKLEPLFDNKSKFVHMSGTWKKDEELEIIKTGSIWYKNAKIHDTAIEIFKKTAIIWNRITLQAVVRGSEVTTEFTVTEVYQKQGKDWKLLDLTFSSVRDTHQIKK